MVLAAVDISRYSFANIHILREQEWSLIIDFPHMHFPCLQTNVLPPDRNLRKAFRRYFPEDLTAAMKESRTGFFSGGSRYHHKDPDECHLQTRPSAPIVFGFRLRVENNLTELSAVSAAYDCPDWLSKAARMLPFGDGWDLGV
jgi:hypothetical protein